MYCHCSLVRRRRGREGRGNSELSSLSPVHSQPGLCPASTDFLIIAELAGSCPATSKTIMEKYSQQKYFFNIFNIIKYIQLNLLNLQHYTNGRCEVTSHCGSEQNLYNNSRLQSWQLSSGLFHSRSPDQPTSYSRSRVHGYIFFQKRRVGGRKNKIFKNSMKNKEFLEKNAFFGW